jgi:cytochrome c6
MLMKRVVIAAFAVALALPALAQEQEAASLYKQRCAMCHGADGKGTSIGKKMGAEDLTAAHLSLADARAVITQGRKKMPEYQSKLTGAQIDALAKYVTTGLK